MTRMILTVILFIPGLLFAGAPHSGPSERRILKRPEMLKLFELEQKLDLAIMRLTYRLIRANGALYEQWLKVKRARLRYLHLTGKSQPTGDLAVSEKKRLELLQRVREEEKKLREQLLDNRELRVLYQKLERVHNALANFNPNP